MVEENLTLTKTVVMILSFEAVPRFCYALVLITSLVFVNCHLGPLTFSIMSFLSSQNIFKLRLRSTIDNYHQTPHASLLFLNNFIINSQYTGLVLWCDCDMTGQ